MSNSSEAQEGNNYPKDESEDNKKTVEANQITDKMILNNI